MRQKTQRPLLLAAMVLVVVCGLFVLVQSPWAQDVLTPKQGGSKPKAPPISWTPDHLSLDGNDTITVTLTAQSAVPASTAELVPELAPYLTVTPAVLPPLAKGATQVITIAANVPAGTPMDTIDGTLHVRAGSSTIARPLPVSLRTWPLWQGSEISFSVPPGWSISPPISDETGFSLTLYYGPSRRGPGLVEGTADIAITSDPTTPSGSISIESAAIPSDPDKCCVEQVLTSTPTIIDGNSGTRIETLWPDGGSLILVRVPRGTNTFRFSLLLLADDPQASSIIGEFDHFLTTIRFSG